jgi:hypothetical protein
MAFALHDLLNKIISVSGLQGAEKGGVGRVRRGGVRQERRIGVGWSSRTEGRGGRLMRWARGGLFELDGVVRGVSGAVASLRAQWHGGGRLAHERTKS